MMEGKVNKPNILWGTILILIGTIFLLDNFHIMHFGDFISTFWPLILVIIGVKIIIDKRRGKGDDQAAILDANKNSIQIKGDRLNENNTFGDINKNIISDDFVGGSANNVFGDIKIDLSAVKIKNENCRISLNSIFGDITVILPKGIPIKAKVSAVAGDLLIKGTRRDGFLPNLEYMDPSYETQSARIFVQAGIVFGSINIF